MKKEFRTKATKKQRKAPSESSATKELVEQIMEVGPTASRAAVIKLGIDVHADRYVVVRHIDGGEPQPPQRFTPTQFLNWAKKQVPLAKQVFSCYEAGPFGYGLHRNLEALGFTNYVVRPRNWDEYGKKVKTDKRDAKGLVLGLDRYVGGNTEAICVVRVPIEAEEQERSQSRQRESLLKEKQRLAAQGRRHALYYGHRLRGSWWGASTGESLRLPAIVRELLEPLRRLIEAIDQQLEAHSKAIIAAVRKAPPFDYSYELIKQ